MKGYLLPNECPACGAANPYVAKVDKRPERCGSCGKPMPPPVTALDSVFNYPKKRRRVRAAEAKEPPC